MMKLLALIGLAMSLAASGTAARVRFTIDDGWRYAPGPLPGAEARGLDDSAWQIVNLPHTWNATDAFDKEKPYRRGIGWYRKSLTIGAGLRGKRLFLYFEGANQVADVYVNGRHAGQHIGGYTAFVFEVTDLVQYEEANVVAVRVDNSFNADIPPLDADFTFYGGIYRNVWLLATDAIHVAVTDYASPGVFASANEQGAVNVAGSVVNQSDRGAELRVVNDVIDEKGVVVATATSIVTVNAGATAAFHQTTPAVARAHRWSPSTPYLYRVRTEVYDGTKLVDEVENPLGFRRFHVDAQNGLTLNGQHLKLVGTNRHQDYAGLGNALSDDLQRRDIRLIKQTGFNFLRLAHYPQAPAVLDEADRQGLVVWEEIPIVNRISTSAAFAENCERMLTEMIRQNFNHPAVFFWGFMNEVTSQKPDPLPAHYDESLLALATRLNERAHREDPGRLTAMALSRPELEDDKRIADITDILGMNLYFGWYYGTTADLGEFLDRIHRLRPNRPLIVSEYGAGSDERIHSLRPTALDFSSEYAQQFHRQSFPQLRDRPFVTGSAVWNQFDFASASRQDTKFGINSKGLFSYDRAPKDVSFYYQAALLSTPVLRIAREWRRRAGDRLQPIRVYTNQPQAELFVNGHSAGTQRVNNDSVQWDVELQPGNNRIVARCVAAGVLARRETLEDTVTVAFESSPTIAVNAGADCDYIDRSHTVWQPDHPYQRGGWGYIGGEARLTHHAILGTDDDALYQTSRESARYQFDVPDGPYEVTLRYVVDRRAVERTLLIDAAAGKGITIDEPSISAIMIRPLF